MVQFILGKIALTENAVITHRDSYLFETLSVVSVRRPLLVPGLITSSGLALFGIGFADLLYLFEIISIITFIALSLCIGLYVAQLQLLSRDLKNTDLSSAVWGHHKALQAIRQQIVEAMTKHTQSSKEASHDNL